MKYKHHKYTWSQPYGDDWTHHRWELVTVNGGIHFHVSLYKNDETAGLELHSLKPINGTDAPDHINCPLTGGRCWHNGTSSYAMDVLWPRIKLQLASGNHAAIFRMLEGEVDKFLDRSLE
jgi:hypothetical protein